MKLFQITEDDLAELERLLPELCSALYPQLGNKDRGPRLRTQLRALQRIVVDVRWDYGPPTEVESIPANELEEEQLESSRPLPWPEPGRVLLECDRCGRGYGIEPHGIIVNLCGPDDKPGNKMCKCLGAKGLAWAVKGNEP